MAAFLDEDGYIDQRVCRFYLLGTCNSGNSCRFLHCKELLKTKMTWACIRYLSSQGCTYGMNCKFDHPEWAKGLFLLPKICGQYRHDKDGDKCGDPDCKYLHFTEEEHETYIKDRIIPERFDRRKRMNQYSSDEEDYAQGDQGSRGDQGARSHQASKERVRDGSGRMNYTDGKRGRSPKRSRSPDPNHAESSGRNHSPSPRRNRSRSPLNQPSRGKKEESPEPSEKRIQKQKRTIKELRAQLDNVSKDNKHLQRQLDDHKRFHDSDQVLITDLMRARDKLEDEVRRLNTEKVDLTKQIGDLFSDNKVIVEENQRLRGLIQSQDGQSRLHTTPTIGQSTYPDTFSATSSHPPLFQQGNWN